MNAALTLLLVQGALGAFDTLWYHEWTQRLPARAGAGRELRLHAARDFAYAVVFGSLGWAAWEGWLAWLLAAILLGEILITLGDFVEEDRTRRLPAGERVMHTVMAIVYGAFLANLIPQMIDWAGRPTRLAAVSFGAVSWLMTAMAGGVFLSGVRDLWASFDLRSAASRGDNLTFLPSPSTTCPAPPAAP
jgi:hypothetical protein